MGEKGTNYSRTRIAKSGRALAFGTTGFATAMTLLMVIGAASGVILAPVYKNTVKSPSSYTSISGCATAKSPLPTWNPVTGMILGISAAKAKTCGKSLGYVGGSSSAYGSGSMYVGIPFKVS